VQHDTSSSHAPPTRAFPSAPPALQHTATVQHTVVCAHSHLVSQLHLGGTTRNTDSTYQHRPFPQDLVKACNTHHFQFARAAALPTPAPLVHEVHLLLLLLLLLMCLTAGEATCILPLQTDWRNNWRYRCLLSSLSLSLSPQCSIPPSRPCCHFVPPSMETHVLLFSIHSPPPLPLLLLLLLHILLAPFELCSMGFFALPFLLSSFIFYFHSCPPCPPVSTTSAEQP